MSKGIAAKLAQMTAEMGSVPKNGRHPSQGYAYQTAEDIARAVRAQVTKHNLIIVPAMSPEDPVVVRPIEGSKASVFGAKLRILVIDGDTGEQLDLPWYGEGMDTQDKGVQKAVTSGMKSWLRAAFHIPSDADDVDGIAAPSAAAPRKKSPAPRPAAANGEITDAQRKLIFATQREAKMPDDDFRELVKRIRGEESTRGMTREQMERVLTGIGDWRRVGAAKDLFNGQEER